MSASLIGRLCQAPSLKPLGSHPHVDHASFRGRPDLCYRLPHALIGLDWGTSLLDALSMRSRHNRFGPDPRPRSDDIAECDLK